MLQKQNNVDPFKPFIVFVSLRNRMPFFGFSSSLDWVWVKTLRGTDSYPKFTPLLESVGANREKV